MKNSIYIFSVVVALGAAHASVAHGACSVANLTRCLDSVCAINVSSNPAARCQYCGTTDAGTPTNTVRSVSVIPNAEGKYFFDITFRNCPSDAFPQGGETVTTAEIIVKEKCLLESLLQPIHMFGSP